MAMFTRRMNWKKDGVKVWTKWINFLETQTDADIEKEIIYPAFGTGKKFKNKIREIAFQLNCHSVHHRAQIARIIREQGFTPPGTDYIFTVFKPAD